MKRQTQIFFYILGLYVIIQFGWWGYHLIELTEELSAKQSVVSKRVLMIIGEGLVFFLLLLFGLWKIRSSIKKDMKLQQNQTNFMLSVTHELKTPLASSRLLLQTIQKRDLPNEKRNELLEKAISENNRLEKMIDNVLNASRLENGKMQVHKESINLPVFVQGIQQRYNKQLNEDRISYNGPDNLTVEMDVFLIETILNNLIENAIKYAPLSSINIDVQQHIDTTTISISDQGSGISADEIKDIFKKFYRSGSEDTRSQKGTGLGLFIASQFAKVHGGKLSYKNNDPQGSLFELTL